jgi:hypothetical protein
MKYFDEFLNIIKRTSHMVFRSFDFDIYASFTFKQLENFIKCWYLDLIFRAIELCAVRLELFTLLEKLSSFFKSKVKNKLLRCSLDLRHFSIWAPMDNCNLIILSKPDLKNNKFLMFTYIKFNHLKFMLLSLTEGEQGVIGLETSSMSTDNDVFFSGSSLLRRCRKLKQWVKRIFFWIFKVGSSEFGWVTK